MPAGLLQPASNPVHLLSTVGGQTGGGERKISFILCCPKQYSHNI